MIIALLSSDPSEGTVVPSYLTFTPADWNDREGHTVTVTGVDDADVDGTVAYTVVTGPACSKDPMYDGLNAPDVAASNTDNDCWPPLTPDARYALSYVEFSGINSTRPSVNDLTIGVSSVAGSRDLSLDYSVGSCWSVPGWIGEPLDGCVEKPAQLDLTNGNCDKAYKVTFALTDGSGTSANASHIVVDDYRLLDLPDWHGYGNLLGFVRAFAPVLRFEQGEIFKPVRPQVNLYNATLRADGRGHPEPAPQDVTENITLEDLAKYSWSFFTIDESCDQANPIDVYTKYQTAYEAVEQTQDPLCIYATAIRTEGPNPTTANDDVIIVQYWMNYYYNDFIACDVYATRDWHEGDWEQVTIAFNKDLDPLQMFFGSHAKERRVWAPEHGPGPYVERWHDTTHPVVYVSLGAHGNFASGDVSLPLLVCEGHSGNGDEFVPEPRQVELLPRWTDLSNAAIGNRWIKYSGYWGTTWLPPRVPDLRYFDDFGIDGERPGFSFEDWPNIPLSGCWRGPAFRRSWSDPVGELFENLIIVARGPVDIVVSDPEGRVCGPNTTTMPRARYEVVGIGSGAANGNGRVAVVIPYPVAGQYRVSVVERREGMSLAAETGLFSLWSTCQQLEKSSTTVVLADSVPVGSIPADGYQMVPDIPHVGASSIVPPVWDGSWASNDSATVEWQLSPAGESFAVGNLVPESLRLNGTVTPILPVTVRGDTLIARFPRGAALQSLSDPVVGTSRRMILTGLFADSLLRLESPAMVKLVTGTVTAVTEPGGVPNLFQVGAPRPNPTNRMFVLPVDVMRHEGRMHASVVDVKGRVIATLADGRFDRGRHWIAWQGTDRDGAAVASGAYWIVVTFEGQRRFARVTVLR